MITVSICKDVEYPHEAELYAAYLKKWKSGGILPSRFGSEGAWEENKSLCNSYVFKIHIKLSDDTPWDAKTPQAARKSNNYLVYTRHWMDPNKYQIISIMAPNAHELARTSFLAELERRAEQFQNSTPE
ncbi:type II toxin-antitoxin system YafO family toxin [Salmonella enterica]|uniref:Type II toxin-antitoxin system YafO family toxin n=1 Tax=Salmonella enterica subsp. enterica serovar Hofit TaxID=2564537 RepID=A0A5W8M983_SALET|nr:type II toxin-antitoxin system YafO family toxin [Salmonella enterica]EBX4071099.1 type II toxin-antitoxin system YafO family toxin [Salmonella enterica subsp. enterica serovar Richmond]EBY1552181.1 type II toxin-antitoxin system YafO family toxin [Salmonella enterica subsp. enterica serovar Hofit]EBZ6829956.1 type II toxin-antitoxin system YafO family toxin [Salmonella enterica subsp. enterica serovar Newport]ECF2557255.1 type II toxin-antitoxin system YafO family toxin [Salmonella enterica